MNVLAEDSRFKAFRIKVVSAIGYPVTDKRACELLMFIKGEKDNPSKFIQADGRTGNARHGRFTTSSSEFKNAVLKYADSLRQSEAMEKAAEEFGIHLPRSYLRYPGSHINRWRSQGFPR